MKYNIRAEFPENKHRDFIVVADTQLAAYTVAEARMRKDFQLGFDTVFDWRGLVVFVNQGVGMRV